MPIYEYKCLDCDKQLEKMQKASDAPLTICENCGGTLEKQWSLSGFQFKGAGWYVTDYTNKTKEPDRGKPAATEKGENTEKSLTTESTAKTESASKETSGDTTAPKTESVSKKD